MGLGESDLLNEKGVGGDGGVASPMVPCSICLDAVMDGGDRATARLPCGHQFHLGLPMDSTTEDHNGSKDSPSAAQFDCIGSAFNAKGVMQCPNCRKIEKGNWLYANGYRSFPDLGIDEWTHDEDLYDLNYSEMAYGVHWCPFSRLARVPSLFEDSESSPSIPYHDMLGHHAIFSEHLASSSGAHSCPYVAYFHPLQQPSSSGSQVSTESVIDGASFHHHWSSLSGPLEVQSSHTFPAVDLRYHNWDPHSSPGTRVGGAEQPSVASVTMRATGIDTDGLLSAGSILHPFLPGHGSASRASSSVVSSMAPPYHGSTRPQPRVHDIHVSHQHHTSPGIRGGPMFSGVQRSGGMRGLAPIGPTSSLPDHSGFYLFPPTGSSGRGSQDAAESIGGNRFYAWERDRFAPFPLMPVERDSAWWGMFPPATGGSDSRSQTGLRHRHGSERSSSQGRPDGSSYRPIHLPRMHPFI